jgi:hypothetical protein
VHNEVIDFVSFNSLMKLRQMRQDVGPLREMRSAEQYLVGKSTLGKHSVGLKVTFGRIKQNSRYMWPYGLDLSGKIQGDQKVSVHLMITVQKTRKIF